MENTESMEVDYSETHHAYDTWKEEGTLVSKEQKHAIDTGKDHGRFRSLTTTTHRRVDYGIRLGMPGLWIQRQIRTTLHSTRFNCRYGCDFFPFIIPFLTP